MHTFRAKTVERAFGSSLFFQNSEHPKIGYFGYNKLSFNWLNIFFDTKKKILVLVGYTGKSLGRLVRSWNKDRQKNVDEAGLWETSIRAEAHYSLALPNSHPVCSRPLALVQRLHFKVTELQVVQCSL